MKKIGLLWFYKKGEGTPYRGRSGLTTLCKKLKGPGLPNQERGKTSDPDRENATTEGIIPWKQRIFADTHTHTLTTGTRASARDRKEINIKQQEGTGGKIYAYRHPPTPLTRRLPQKRHKHRTKPHPVQTHQPTSWRSKKALASRPHEKIWSYQVGAMTDDGRNEPGRKKTRTPPQMKL